MDEVCVGDVVGPVHLERVAHGGFVVGRLDGRVLFVRHGLPGEQVMVRLTDTSQSRFWRGDACEVRRASPQRVAAPCPVAAQCGGCDLQHVSPSGQLDWKTAVLREQLQRLAGWDWAGEVEAVADGTTGWRTRMRYHVSEGRVGLRASRSHQVVDLPEQGCLLAHPEGPTVADLRQLARGAQEVIEVAVASSGVSVLVDGAVAQGEAVVHQTVRGSNFAVEASGFWQVHPQAAAVLTEQVLSGLQPRPGDVALDLYCGVGLFAAALTAAGCQVTGVEIDGPAVRHAQRNVPEARFVASPVDRSFRRLPRRVDLAVLDPARAGAGRQVVRRVTTLRPRRVVHIGCDPAAFARDLGCWLAEGWQVENVRAFDLFPMTQHLEAVAVLSRAK